MSLLVDTVKEIIRNDICPKSDLVYSYESLADLLEEMGLEENKTKNKNTIFIKYKYENKVWISFIFDGTHVGMKMPVFEEVLKENKRSNPLYCLHIAYSFLRDNCINNHEQGKALESLGFLLSAYMSYITDYKFKSKRILWEK